MREQLKKFEGDRKKFYGSFETYGKDEYGGRTFLFKNVRYKDSSIFVSDHVWIRSNKNITLQEGELVEFEAEIKSYVRDLEVDYGLAGMTDVKRIEPLSFDGCKNCIHKTIKEGDMVCIKEDKVLEDTIPKWWCPYIEQYLRENIDCSCTSCDDFTIYEKMVHCEHYGQPIGSIKNFIKKQKTPSWCLEEVISI